MYSPLRERLGEECWLFGVLTMGPTIVEVNSFSKDESPLPLGGKKKRKGKKNREQWSLGAILQKIFKNKIYFLCDLGRKKIRQVERRPY